MNPFLNYRRCISCRLFAPKESFWRIVRLHPSGQIQLDQGMGRAAYICPQPNCLQLARQKNRLGRALKANIPETLYESLQKRLGTAKQGSPNQD